MRLSWLSFVLGVVVILVSGPALAVWFMPILTVVSMHESRSAPVPWIMGLGSVCLIVSLIGLVLGIVQMRRGIKPAWTGIVGIVLGLLNSGSWVMFLLFIAPQLLQTYRALGGTRP